MVNASMIKMVILWSNLVVKSKVYHFDHRYEICILAMVMIKMDIFVVKFRGKILGVPF